MRLCLKVCVVLGFVVLNGVQNALVSTGFGMYDGGSFFTSNGREVYTFLGVAYAEPPVGEDKFSKAKPAKKRTVVQPAKDYSSPCVQFESLRQTDQVTGSDDCLYLNIYTTSVSNTSKLPVLIFFHGGAFMFGTNKIYKSDYLLANHNIVFVTVNYRLGPFGFLSTEDDVVSGNNGLKDQVLALNWVRDHIAAFGGDPNQVTISGNSAGGASVHYHYLSPLSRGLFNKGIMSSGSAINPWALTEKPLMKAKMLAQAVNCSTVSTDTMVNCLRKRSSKEILLTIKPLFMPWDSNPFSPFGPVIEYSTRHPFLTEHPYLLIKRGKTFDGPLLVSLTTEEGLYPAGTFINQKDLLKELNDNWDSIAPHLLDYNYTISPGTHTVNQDIRKHYFGSEEISPQTTHKVIKMLSDRLFNVDVNLAVRLQTMAMKSPVYMFVFGYRGNISLSDLITKTKTNFGVSHCDDLFYIVFTGFFARMQSVSDKAMVEALTNIWVTFVQMGKPSPWEGALWEPVQQDSLQTGVLNYLLIRGPRDMKIAKNNNFGDYQFWKSLRLNENEWYQNNNSWTSFPIYFMFELLAMCGVFCVILFYKLLI